MQCIKALKTALLPGSVVLAAVPFQSQDQNKDAKKEPQAVKPSELPIYGAPAVSKPANDQDSYGPLEEMVGTVRKEITSYLDIVEEYKQKVWETLQQQHQNSEGILNYLKEEENVLPRSGAIALAGLTGYILGLRGGRFRRLVFTTTGAGSMAALCYPREAQEYFDISLVTTRQYVLIGYHFLSQTAQDLIKGDKEGDKEGSKKTSD